MDIWKSYEGKNVYVILKNKRNYSGKIISVDDSIRPLVWIVMIDKKGNQVTFSVEEIEVIQEEENEN